MADIDETLYQDTKQNLRSAANGDEELLALVEEQLEDMEETGYFDYEEHRSCGYPCTHCGEEDEYDD